MTARLWRPRIDAARATKYETFEHAHSLPMFRRQEAFAGVVVLGSGEERAALTFWTDMRAVNALANSPAYSVAEPSTRTGTSRRKGRIHEQRH